MLSNDCTSVIQFNLHSISLHDRYGNEFQRTRTMEKSSEQEHRCSSFENNRRISSNHMLEIIPIEFPFRDQCSID